MRVHDPRAELERAISERRENYRALSLMLRRNPAYLQQYVKRGTPAKLSDHDRRALADYLGIDEALLGHAPLPRRLANSDRAAPPRPRGSGSDLVVVPRLDVEASAGPGALSASEGKLGQYGFGQGWLQRLSGGDPAKLSIVRVKGDSMAPTLTDGDDILVERLDGGERVRDGIYVLQRDDALLVKRLALGRTPGKLDVLSDNTAYPSWHDCDSREVQVLGRVIWSARRHA